MAHVGSGSALQASLLESQLSADDAPPYWRRYAPYQRGLMLTIGLSSFCALVGYSCFSKASRMTSNVRDRNDPITLAEVNSWAQPPPFFRISATSPYDAGLQHGRVAKERIHDWFASPEVRSVITWVKGNGTKQFQQLKRDNAAEFPRDVEEMQGIADGAGVDIDKVWIANMLNDIENLMTIEGAPLAHCSDEYVHTSEGLAHGHNDDWSETAAKSWYFLSVEPAKGTSSVTPCAGMAYPATLVGWAPTWNSHGMYHTQNTLIPKSSRAGGLACTLVQRRALCNSRNLDEYTKAVTVPGWSDGASMNVVDTRGNRMANVELWEDRHSVFEVTQSMGNYSHFNNYKHLLKANGEEIDKGIAFYAQRDARQAVVDALPPPRHDVDIMDRLSNPQVFRSNPNRTLVTVIVNATVGSVKVWCCGVRPTAAPNSPIYHWNLNTFFNV